MSSSRLWAALLAALAILVVVGCGGGGGDGDAFEEVDLAQIRIALAGLPVACSLGGSPSQDVATLIKYARLAPDAEVDGRTMREVLADAASTLEGCGLTTPAARLDRARETLASGSGSGDAGGTAATEPTETAAVAASDADIALMEDIDNGIERLTKALDPVAACGQGDAACVLPVVRATGDVADQELARLEPGIADADAACVATLRRRIGPPCRATASRATTPSRTWRRKPVTNS